MPRSVSYLEMRLQNACSFFTAILTTFVTTHKAALGSMRSTMRVAQGILDQVEAFLSFH